MLRVPFILANGFHQLVIGKQLEWNGYAPWFRVSLRIVNRDLHIQMTEIAAMEALDGMIGVGMRMPSVVQIGLIVEPAAVHNKRIAFPFPNRVTHPGGLHVFRESAPIGEDLAEAA